MELQGPVGGQRDIETSHEVVVYGATSVAQEEVIVAKRAGGDANTGQVVQILHHVRLQTQQNTHTRS